MYILIIVEFLRAKKYIVLEISMFFMTMGKRSSHAKRKIPLYLDNSQFLFFGVVIIERLSLIQSTEMLDNYKHSNLTIVTVQFKPVLQQ